MALVISPQIAEKLAKKHSVSQEEVAQCFANRTGRYLLETRARHATNPATMWFIAETDYGRKLKIAFVPENGNIYIRTAFVPDATELGIYARHGNGTV